MLLGCVAGFIVGKQQNPRKQALQALTDAASSGYRTDLALMKKGLRQSIKKLNRCLIRTDLALMKKGLRPKLYILDNPPLLY